MKTIYLTDKKLKKSIFNFFSTSLLLEQNIYTDIPLGTSIPLRPNLLSLEIYEG